MSTDKNDSPGFLASIDRRLLMIGGAAVVAVIIGAGAYFAVGGSDSATSAEKARTTVARTGWDTLVDSANDAASSESGSLCDRALTRARNYGIVPASTALTSSESETQVQNRFTCAAKADDGATFTLAVDKTCEDIADHSCLAIHTVTQADGRTLFERL
jgi:hypothetical protein